MAMYAFGPFRLDANAEILFRGSDPLPVGKRAVAPVSKDTLNDAAWSGLAIGEGNLTMQIAALRRALGAVPGGEDWIVTLPRRGYRFVGPDVTKSEALAAATPTVDPTTKLAPQGALTAASRAANFPESSNPTLPDRPSIAVLPFQNMSGEPEQEYFADGMVEDITG